MPFKKVKGGWKWGTKPKKPTTKKKAKEIAKAAYASGYEKRKRKKISQ